jgi:hypothetical protein
VSDVDKFLSQELGKRIAKGIQKKKIKIKAEVSEIKSRKTIERIKGEAA